MGKYAHADLQNLVDSSVPPCDLTRVSLFNSSLLKCEKEASKIVAHSR